VYLLWFISLYKLLLGTVQTLAFIYLFTPNLFWGFWTADSRRFTQIIFIIIFSIKSALICVICGLKTHKIDKFHIRCKQVYKYQWYYVRIIAIEMRLWYKYSIFVSILIPVYFLLFSLFPYHPLSEALKELLNGFILEIKNSKKEFFQKKIIFHWKKPDNF